MFDSITFGNAIRHCRKKMNLKIIDIATIIDIDESYLGQIERGEKIPSVDVALAIVNCFETNFQSFLSSATPDIADDNILLRKEIAHKFPKLSPAEKQFICKTINKF